MKKTILTLFLIGGLLASCNQSKKTEETDVNANTEVIDMHNAENSLDIEGVYSGVLPCADCEGIETTLELKPDNSYELTSIYITPEKEEFKQVGVWSIRENTLTLEDNDQNQIDRKLNVGEGFVKFLDSDGNEITGELAEHYILEKK